MFLCLKTTKAIPQNRQVGDGFCCQCAYYYSAGCAGVSVAGVPLAGASALGSSAFGSSALGSSLAGSVALGSSVFSALRLRKL